MTILNALYSLILDGLINMVNNMLVMVMSFLNQITFDFWDNYIIQGLLSFSMWINRIVFILAFVFAFVDVAEEAGSFKQIDWLAFFLNFAKAFLFVEMYSFLAIGIMQSANILTSNLNFDMTISSDTVLGSVGNALGFIKGNGLAYLLAVLGVNIGVICFIGIAIKRFGLMLVQVFSSAFYVPDIVRGETTKLGDWMRQTIAIAFTYTFQYILFYCGFILLMSSTDFVTTIMAVGLWLAVPAVSQILAKYGYSSGVKGGSALTSMASQGLQLMSKR